MAEPNDLPLEFLAKLAATNPSTTTSEEEAAEGLIMADLATLVPKLEAAKFICQFESAIKQYCDQIEIIVTPELFHRIHDIIHEWFDALPTMDNASGRAMRYTNELFPDA